MTEYRIYAAVMLILDETGESVSRALIARTSVCDTFQQPVDDHRMQERGVDIGADSS